ncbi:MAG: NAD(P)-dependent oxidoreductase [Nanoarchaeota archaeon]|nr:NAD(P)-dependent oxidoreductase [Nanoarchaeota archaeon]MBU1320873.1 NAD(P)-dependent oxidoreductase [Nanoarchaeota archaeon]MBU1597779.1 NAD(P)-dependent oxidoreductase [Nanoarchaeota archaeon]MBU2441230.1 NAD(P)-dependent oxidoreductase [Nanoarchaeota archaeon]
MSAIKGIIKDIKRVIIFGHNGFIGRHLIEYFQQQNPDIKLVGKSFPDFDLTKEEDMQSLKDLFDMNTAVVMLSAIKPNFGNDLDAFTKNIGMIVNLCRLMQKYPVRRFIYFSSAAVYGEDIHNTSITENTEINARSFYGMAKYACERLLWKTFEDSEKSSLLVLRPPVIYGPDEGAASYNPAGFLKKILGKEKLILWGDGSEKREFIYIDDVVKIVNKFTFNDYKGVLNIASGKSHTFKDALDIISSLVAEINIAVNVESRERSKDKVDNVFDNKLLAKALPDFEFITLEQGIKKIFEIENKK